MNLEDIYGVSSKPNLAPTLSGSITEVFAKRTRTVIHLSLKDSIPGHGPITDMTFSLAKNGVRSTFYQYYITLFCSLAVL